MKRFLLLASILITSQLSAQDLQFQWVKNWPFAIDMRTCDSEDNIYLAGRVFDTLQYGGYTLINHDIGQGDVQRCCFTGFIFGRKSETES